MQKEPSVVEHSAECQLGCSLIQFEVDQLNFGIAQAGNGRNVYAK